MQSTVPPWSDLPKDLWATIGRRLDTHVDVLRFRSVCSSWRSLIPPSHHNSPRFPVQLPFPDMEPTFISRSTLYLLQPTQESISQRSSSDSGAWLIKIAEEAQEEVETDAWSVIQDRVRVCLLNPLTRRPLRYKPTKSPAKLNTLEFRVWEIGKEYAFEYDSENDMGVDPAWGRKVVMCPSSPWTDAAECSFVAVYQGGKLGYWKYGDEEWHVIGDANTKYDDAMVYKGQFYVVDRLGTVSWIDGCLRVVQFSPPMCGGGDRKHLVECGGDIYVVDRYIDENQGEDEYLEGAAVGFRVYRLDQEWGKWDEVRNLGDAVLFLGDHSCFSVPARELGGCIRNCIYFAETGMDFYGYVRAFSMEDRSIERIASSPDYLRIMWPPPTWLVPKPPLLDVSDSILSSGKLE